MRGAGLLLCALDRGACALRGQLAVDASVPLNSMVIARMSTMARPVWSATVCCLSPDGGCSPRKASPIYYLLVVTTPLSPIGGVFGELFALAVSAKEPDCVRPRRSAGPSRRKFENRCRALPALWPLPAPPTLNGHQDCPADNQRCACWFRNRRTRSRLNYKLKAAI
jgi:hypothetical protein